MKSWSPSLAFALTLLFPAFAPAFAAEPKVEETVVGPANAGGLYAVSPRGAHVAYALNKGSRLAVVVDGIEGPVCDELFNPIGQSYFSPPQFGVIVAGAGGQNANTSLAVIFSADGTHHAYAGRQGNEYVIIHDGKEVGRGPRPFLALNYGPLTLSPGGKFVHWGEMQPLGAGATGSWRLVINGKAGPWGSHVGWEPVFSPDDTRYAYLLASLTERDKRTLIVDGKAAAYTGNAPVFTADGQVLLTVAGGNTVLADGKPSGAAGLQIDLVKPAPVGRRYAVIARKKVVNGQGLGVLFLDGKEVAGTEGAQSISFSPDGRRYALSCINPAAKSAFMIVDGKKGVEYQSVADSKYVAWTSDSTKVIYTAVSAGRQFVVVDTKEFPVPGLNLQGNSPVALPARGNRYAFSTYDGTNRNFSVVVDGESVLPPGLWPNGATLTFSADGSRYAYVVNPIGRNEIAGLVVDGTLVNDLVVGAFNAAGANALNVGGITAARNPYFQFSRDGKYLARMARLPNNTRAGLYVNDKLTHPTSYQVSHFAFSPDSRHVYWLAGEKFPDRAPFYTVAYVDGQPVAKLSGDPFQATPGTWEVGADGVLTFLGVVGTDVKRFRVTPAADMDVEKVVARSTEKQASDLAAAAAAKKQAEDDAAAARAKAKADADAVAAKRKADLDAANAARAKARADAAAARQKK